MPVGLEETFDGVKVAPDVTYTNTFQYPERNTKVTFLHSPVNKQIYWQLNKKITFAKPNLDAIERPNTRHAYEETRASLETFIRRGLVKSSLRSQLRLENEVIKPIAFLNRVPPTTPSNGSRKARSPKKLNSTKSRPQSIKAPWTIESPNVVGQPTAASSYCST